MHSDYDPGQLGRGGGQANLTSLSQRHATSFKAATH